MTSRLHPDVFDSLAALSKFVDVPECAQLFHERHKGGIDIAVRAIHHLMHSNPDLRTILAFTGAPVAVTARTLRDWHKDARVSDAEIKTLGKHVEIAVRAVLPAFSDPKLPTFLRQCRWGIEGAFAESQETARQVHGEPRLQTA